MIINDNHGILRGVSESDEGATKQVSVEISQTSSNQVINMWQCPGVCRQHVFFISAATKKPCIKQRFSWFTLNPGLTKLDYELEGYLPIVSRVLNLTYEFYLGL